MPFILHSVTASLQLLSVVGSQWTPPNAPSPHGRSPCLAEQFPQSWLWWTQGQLDRLGPFPRKITNEKDPIQSHLLPDPSSLLLGPPPTVRTGHSSRSDLGPAPQS